MAMTLRDYLAFRCNQMLRMERAVLQMNDTMADEVQQPQLKDALRRHSSTTQQQISNLEQVVQQLGQAQGGQQQEGLMGRMEQMLGMGGEDKGVPITDAMMREHKQFMDMNPPQNLIDINDALEGDKVEHLEIASYSGLIALANQLGESQIAQKLQQNLQGEQGMRDTIETSLPSMLSQLAGGEGRMAA